jgi:hypothetical protein
VLTGAVEGIIIREGRLVMDARRGMTLLLEIGASSLAAIAIQFLALTSCNPADYGSFSLVYIIYAGFLSLGLSCVSEPWTVESRRRAIEWESYVQPSMLLAVVAGVATLSSSAWEVGLAVSTLFSLAVLCSTYRMLARFYSASRRERRYLIPADVVYVLVVIVCWIVVSRRMPALESVALCWFLSAFVSCVLSRSIRLPHFRMVRAWAHDLWQTIRGLLADMLLLNLGTILMPLVLRVPMGAAGFGLYRLQSTLAAPVRLLLAPIRPLLGKMPLRWHYKIGNVFALSGLALALGTVMFVGLSWLSETQLVEGSIIHAAAAQYRLEISLFVSANLMTTFFNFVNRVSVSARGLIVLRGVQLVGLVAGPVLGFLVGGVKGAMWGAIMAEVSQAFLYVVLSRRWAL